MPIRINEKMPVAKRLNRMTEKESTELQLLRLLPNSPLQTGVASVRLDSHRYKNISEEYLQNYYKAFSEVSAQYFDGLIITGEPIETLWFIRLRHRIH